MALDCFDLHHIKYVVKLHLTVITNIKKVCQINA